MIIQEQNGDLDRRSMINMIDILEKKIVVKEKLHQTSNFIMNGFKSYTLSIPEFPNMFCVSSSKFNSSWLQSISKSQSKSASSCSSSSSSSSSPPQNDLFFKTCPCCGNIS